MVKFLRSCISKPKLKNNKSKTTKLTLNAFSSLSFEMQSVGVCQNMTRVDIERGKELGE